ncbi:hypothetical protein AMELA_G00279880 [Ameiurus melas]|uniref:N-alpha-acetyltransferase 20 n=1 Tax=Ameiurus melas TaxID=219545 RepID=A0A7J5ZKI6_AMEME|nr:hypothetical protein AMELA_G00279880 [Ameiurus melas]
MTTLRAFNCDDLFKFNNINLDPLTETYGIPFYLQYLAHWPEYFIVAEAPGGELMGYIMGKAEGSVAREEWHGHVTALSVAPEFRRLGLAAKLMDMLEEISERKGGFFVDLFVRGSNQVAVNMYKQLGHRLQNRDRILLGSNENRTKTPTVKSCFLIIAPFISSLLF